jgi:hypothetical protein
VERDEHPGTSGPGTRTFERGRPPAGTPVVMDHRRGRPSVP